MYNSKLVYHERSAADIIKLAMIQVFHGSIYAPRAVLNYVGRTRIEGALLARSLNSVGLLELFFARPTTGSNGEKCQPPGGSVPPPATPDDPPDPSDLPMLY